MTGLALVPNNNEDYKKQSQDSLEGQLRVRGLAHIHTQLPAAACRTPAPAQHPVCTKHTGAGLG